MPALFKKKYHTYVATCFDSYRSSSGLLQKEPLTHSISCSSSHWKLALHFRTCFKFLCWETTWAWPAAASCSESFRCAQCSGGVKLHVRCASCSVSIVPPTLHTHLHLHAAIIIRTSGRRLRAVRQSSAISDIGEHWTEKYCPSVFGVTGTCWRTTFCSAVLSAGHWESRDWEQQWMLYKRRNSAYQFLICAADVSLYSADTKCEEDTQRHC